MIEAGALDPYFPRTWSVNWELPAAVRIWTGTNPGLSSGTVASAVLSFTYLNSLGWTDLKVTSLKQSLVPKLVPLITIRCPGFTGSGVTFVILGWALMSHTGAWATALGGAVVGFTGEPFWALVLSDFASTTPP